LSATVLFVNSFPDFDADKSKGRKTLVILMGRDKAAFTFPFFIIVAYALIFAGILFGFTKVYSLASLLSLPFALKAMIAMRKDNKTTKGLIPAMSAVVTYSRITGFVLAVSLLFL
jgi:1,4-dihydroxy-2-naphthoate octaprenyltransferase